MSNSTTTTTFAAVPNSFTRTPEPVKLAHKDVKVERSGVSIILPPSMSIPEAKEWLNRQEIAEETEMAIHETIRAYPLEGAWALAQVLQQKFGFYENVSTPGMFGPIPPTLVGLPTGVDTTVQVPWGGISIPNVAGRLECGFADDNGRLVFALKGKIKRKSQAIVEEIVREVKAYVKTQSLYRGKAVRVSFGETFNPTDAPTFIDVSQVRPEELIFSADLRTQIDTSILTPIEYTEACREFKVPLKRGILLEGPYGVGKSLTANVVARKCEENGWTFIYLTDVEDLDMAIRFAGQYQPAVIFAEDIDRTVTGDRTSDMDDVLNTIDGVDTKNSEIMVILTTNHVDKINSAMLRPGRLDAVINIHAPDEEAAGQLIRLYARDLLESDEDVTLPAKRLAGQIPAVIREVVERSKLYAIRRTSGAYTPKLTAVDLLRASEGMMRHLELMRPEVKDTRSDLVKAAEVIAKARMASAPESIHAVPRLANGHAEERPSKSVLGC